MHAGTRTRRPGGSWTAYAAAMAAIACCVPLRGEDATFVEVAQSVGIVTTHAPAPGLEVFSAILVNMTSGGVVGDFDNDGDQDIFIVVGGGTPDALYINDGTGHFTDQAAAWGVAVKHMGLAAAVGDYDNDGWLDIFVTSCGLAGSQPAPGKHRLYRNTGRGHFAEAAVAAGVNTASPIKCDGMGAAWGDYDLDGDLDLFVAGWLPNAGGNRLFRNNGNGTFTDVTTVAGMSFAGVYGFSPRFIDMDGDRYPELLLAADFHTSRYYRNNGDGTFSNLTATCGAGIDDNGMGQTVGDFDNDGTLDWYVTSVYSTGNPEVPGTGNMLYRGTGTHLFTEGSIAAGVNNGNWGWGTAAVDLDHDGWLDLLETNGWSAYPEFVNSPSRVWINQHDGTFVDKAASNGLWHTLLGRGLLTADFDNDGDRDVLIFASREKPKLYRNDLPRTPDTHALTIRLDTRDAIRLAPNGIGAKILVTTGAGTQQRVIEAGTNFQSQDELSAHFGLGAATSADVRILWPDGAASFFRDVHPDQILTIASGERSDLDQDGRVGASDIAILLGAWGPIDAADPIDLTADGQVDSADLAVLLANWAP